MKPASVSWKSTYSSRAIGYLQRRAENIDHLEGGRDRVAAGYR